MKVKALGFCVPTAEQHKIVFMLDQHSAGRWYGVALGAVSVGDACAFFGRCAHKRLSIPLRKAPYRQCNRSASRVTQKYANWRIVEGRFRLHYSET